MGYGKALTRQTDSYRCARYLSDPDSTDCRIITGPGGIPLVLAGLGLLSINEPWAQKWLHYVRQHSEGFRELFFPDKKAIQWHGICLSSY